MSVGSAAVDPGAAWALPAAAVLALRVLGVLVGALGMYTAARLGWRLGGPSGALIAFGLGGFLMLPFVPERI